MSFADHFSIVAADYSRFRPDYPAALFDAIADYSREHDTIWEVGAGSGQATTGLAGRFGRVVATDGSDSQLARNSATTLRAVATAENAPLPSNSADVVAAAQCIHWFDRDRFYAEVRRVVRPGGTIAVWTYAFPSVDARLDPVIMHFANEVVGRYWTPERRLVNERYETLPFPFGGAERLVFEHPVEMSGEDVLGLFSTWSAVNRARAATGTDPVEAYRSTWTEAWGDLGQVRTLRWPMRLLLGRV